jgi:hypothetical protein
MNNIYWALIGIVSAAVATAIILYIVLKSEDNLDQIADIENPSIATFLGHNFYFTAHYYLTEHISSLGCGW